MYIISGDQIINLDNVLNIRLHEKFISYRYSGIDRYHVIGQYETEERAREVWDKIMSVISHEVFCTVNGEMRTPATIRLPEK